MKNFITQISNPPTKVMVIGPMFTPEAKVIAETSALYNLVEVGNNSLHCRAGIDYDVNKTMLTFSLLPPRNHQPLEIFYANHGLLNNRQAMRTVGVIHVGGGGGCRQCNRAS